MIDRLHEYPLYVSKWVHAPWFLTIRQDPNFYSFLNHKTLPKEMAESYAAYKQIKWCIKHKHNITETLQSQPNNSSQPPSETIVTQHQDYPPENQEMYIVDLCAGKGFLSTLLYFKFPNSNILMVDNCTRMNTDHLDSMPRIEFWNVDIRSKRFANHIRERLQERPFVVLVGIHLCGDLSDILVDLFNKLTNIKCAILCPCCISKKEVAILARCKETGESSYQLWCERIVSDVGQCVYKDLSTIEKCGSTKNNFIMAIR